MIGDPQRDGPGLLGSLRRAMRGGNGGRQAPDSVALSGPEVAALVECLYSANTEGISGLEPAKTAAALAIMARKGDDWSNGAAWRNLHGLLGGNPEAGLCGGLGPPRDRGR